MNSRRFGLQFSHVLFLTGLMIPFQNCGEGMSSREIALDPVYLNEFGDISSPDLSIISPPAGAYTKDNVTVTGICEANLPVHLSINNRKNPTSADCIGGSFSSSLKLNSPDGVYTLYVVQRDVAGNTSVKEISFTKDTVSPNPQFTSPTASAQLNSQALIVSGQCESGIKVLIDGNALSAPVEAPCFSNSFQAAVNLVNSNGTKTIRLQQTDSAGNTGSASRFIQINIAAGSPVIKISSPASNTITKNSISLTGTCVSGLSVKISGTGVKQQSQINCNSGSFSSSVQLSNGDGIKNIIVSQTNAQNLTGQDSRSFILDTTPPAVTILTPTAGTKDTTGVNVGGGCENGLDVVINGPGVASQVIVPCSSGMFQSMINFSSGLGVKTVHVSQTDAIGNKGADSRAFERIEPPPADGKLLYANNCASCHFPLASTSKSNRTASQIKNAISNEVSMRHIVLTDPEIDAIALALKSSAAPPSPDALFHADAYGKTGIQRLTKQQLADTVEMIFGMSLGSMKDLIPNDSPSATYFENDYQALAVSSPLVADYNSFAKAFAGEFVKSSSRISQLGGCTPSSANDTNCFKSFIQKTGLKVLRRPLTTTEVQTYSDAFMPIAVAEGSFSAAVETAVMALLQHPEFLYRIENTTNLNQYQIASRISFLILGTGPDDALLAAASRNELSNENNRIAQASRLLNTAQAKLNFQRFHAQWLGYSDTYFPPHLNEQAIREESAALINRVVFERNADWLQIFAWPETYVDRDLASHYGLSGAPNSGKAWVTYPSGRKAGILSHATVATLGAKFNDTSPTLRGYELYKRLFCGELPGSIPSNVDVDDPPGHSADCKVQRYSMRSNPSCASCHGITDNIGFGLEFIGAFGEWRTSEPNLPACTIDGTGSFDGESFYGPESFAQLVVSQPKTSACAATQLFEYFVGRKSTAADSATLQALQGQYYETPDLKSIIMAMVKTPAITRKGF